jgi:hypothetical protein
MHPDTASAVRILQDRLSAVESHDFRRAERYEAALDDLVRNPDRAGPVGHLVRNASSYGLKRSVRRARLAPRHEPKAVVTDEGPIASPEALVTDDRVLQLRVDLIDLVDRTFAGDDRRSMLRLLDGATVADLATDVGIPVGRLQVRISRARARARAVA